MVKILYYGDEIGMIDHDKISWDDTQDVQACSMDPNEYNEYSRDPQRTPFQWDDSQFAGFSRVKPWMEVNPNYGNLNLKQENEAETSIFYDFKNISRIDRDFPYLQTRINSQVILLMRIYEDSKLVLINLGNDESLSTVNLNKFFESSEIDFRASPVRLSVYFSSTKSKRLVKLYFLCFISILIFCLFQRNIRSIPRFHPSALRSSRFHVARKHFESFICNSIDGTRPRFRELFHLEFQI